MAKFKGKYKVGDVLRIIHKDQCENIHIDSYYEIVRCCDAKHTERGMYDLRGLTKESRVLSMNCVIFENEVIGYYGNTKDGTCDPAFRILFTS